MLTGGPTDQNIQARTGVLIVTEHQLRKMKGLPSFFAGLFVETPAAASICDVTPPIRRRLYRKRPTAELAGAPTSAVRFLAFQASHHNITGLAM